MMPQADTAACDDSLVAATRETRLGLSKANRELGYSRHARTSARCWSRDPGSTQAVSAAADSFRAGAGAHYSIAYCH